MNSEFTLISSTLAAIAGIFFISGLAVLSGGRRK